MPDIDAISGARSLDRSERSPAQSHGTTDLAAALRDIERPFWLTDEGAVSRDPLSAPDAAHAPRFVPACPVSALGDPGFCRALGIRYAYLAGAMANGIASVDLVAAMADAGMLGFFGAAGLPIDAVDRAITQLRERVGDRPHGFNFIHSPNEPALEAALAALYIERDVRLVEASAFLDLTPAIVRYRAHGLRRDAGGHIVAKNRVIAKVSRIEVARKFWSPAPAAILDALVADGELTAEEAALAREVPVAEDITAEADSGGHTDNRPALALFPTLLALRDTAQRQYDQAGEAHGAPVLRLGAAGGIATPTAAAAAFAMGASWVMIGSVHQACVESGSSDTVRKMLADAEQADVTMAPAADMFEMGVKVQVLKRGTMFPMRATKLYEIYRSAAGLDAIPATERATLEKSIFRAPLGDVWRETVAYWETRDPRQITKAERDEKHRMALTFQWYLGQSSRWANSGEPSRQLDYQVWCGPAMGAFNEWARDTFLADPSARQVATVARNILFGAAVLTRANILQTQGVMIGANDRTPPPMRDDELAPWFRPTAPDNGRT